MPPQSVVKGLILSPGQSSGEFDCGTVGAIRVVHVRHGLFRDSLGDAFFQQFSPNRGGAARVVIVAAFGPQASELIVVEKGLLSQRGDNSVNDVLWKALSQSNAHLGFAAGPVSEQSQRRVTGFLVLSGVAHDLIVLRSFIVIKVQNAIQNEVKHLIPCNTTFVLL